MGRGFEVFGAIVKAGDFDRLLLRPRSTITQLLGHELTIRRVGRLVQGIAVLAYAIAGTICVFLGLLVMQATSAFWTTESLEVWNAFTYGGVTMAQYPLSIYRPWFRQFFLFVIPLGCINYLPVVAIL